MIEASAPGKLFIAGEYAVVEPGFPAIIVAVDQFITVRLEQRNDIGSIRSFQYGELPVLWTRQDGQLVLDKRENPFHYILAAMELTERYAAEQGRELSFYELSVTSELDNSTGKKYGLGSSGAVTVATVKALCEYYQLEATPKQIFKLAALAHLSVQGNGSCGDIAASVYGGWIAFTTFERQWVMDKCKSESLTTLLALVWPSLSIEPLVPPADLRLVIGWTGSPASTSSLVDKVTQQRKMDQYSYEQFLEESKECVEMMIEAFGKNDIPMIQKQIRHNRKLLQQMSKKTNVTIETPALNKLCELAETYHGAAKSSGAGGGDCGIVIFQQKEGILPLITAWENEEITNLPLHVYHYNKK
ncbi:phosphomevalonate kinase [Carnobacterium gallinarum]|uniref:phosphomevalonate kinase n=1 Tax=Carnobacterium gallinarum TaxID=2749 RepID=UPI00055432AD|nr:phosphomevalonate kinase [Carnobacterium gallinarum]